MRKAEVYSNGILAGTLTETDDGKYIFKYDESYLVDASCRAISLSFPKSQTEFVSDFLFPLFFNMLSEGANKDFQCSNLKIDENDDFGLLLATAKYDTIGTITIKELNQ